MNRAKCSEDFYSSSTKIPNKFSGVAATLSLHLTDEPQILSKKRNEQSPQTS
jgi:hypothetical protein